MKCLFLKGLQVFQDQAGARNSLHFLRTKEGKEIDFLVVQEKKGTHLIEVKWADDRPSSSFGPFKKYFPDAVTIQLVQKLDRSYSTPTGIRIEKADEWLKRLNLEIVWEKEVQT